MQGLGQRRLVVVLTSAAVATALGTFGGTGVSAAEQPSAPFIDGRVIAFDLPGVSAVSPVGAFLPGSPINSNPALAAQTQPGEVLDPTRIVVGSRSNFGAPKANADQFEGSFLSIDPDGADLAVPASFASAGDQASVLGGAVQMYSAQSPMWLNGFYNPAAVTADQTGVSNPLGMSINNAFGRLWPANAPYGLNGPGSSSITDPDGRPLKGAPNPRTGGVISATSQAGSRRRSSPAPSPRRRWAQPCSADPRMAPVEPCSRWWWRTAASSKSTRKRRSTASPRPAPCSRSRIGPGPSRTRATRSATSSRASARS
jgi:hypothetical protein